MCDVVVSDYRRHTSRCNRRKASSSAPSRSHDVGWNPQLPSTRSKSVSQRHRCGRCGRSVLNCELSMDLGQNQRRSSVCSQFRDVGVDHGCCIAHSLCKRLCVRLRTKLLQLCWHDERRRADAARDDVVRRRPSTPPWDVAHRERSAAGGTYQCVWATAPIAVSSSSCTGFPANLASTEKCEQRLVEYCVVEHLRVHSIVLDTRFTSTRGSVSAFPCHLFRRTHRVRGTGCRNSSSSSTIFAERY